MTPDKKIEEYLERASKIKEKFKYSGGVIEIAKMIQLEEHRGLEHCKHSEWEDQKHLSGASYQSCKNCGVAKM